MSHKAEAQKEPWERRRGESAKAYAAFEVYRSLGAARSLAKCGRKMGRSLPTLERWSSKHSWVMRAEAWDDSSAREARRGELEAAREMARRQASIGQGGQGYVVAALNALQERLRSSAPPSELEVALVLRRLGGAVNDFARLERLARGQPTEQVEERSRQVQVQVDAAEVDVDDLLRDPDLAAVFDAIAKRQETSE